MFFNSVKEINRLRKEINRLLSKEVSNIYSKVTIEEKNWRSQNFHFQGLKNLQPCQFWGAPSHKYIIAFENFLLQLKIRRVEPKLCVWLFYYFYFYRNYDALKSMSPCILLNKDISFKKSETESKLENRAHNFRETNLVLQII